MVIGVLVWQREDRSISFPKRLGVFLFNLCVCVFTFPWPVGILLREPLCETMRPQAGAVLAVRAVDVLVWPPFVSAGGWTPGARPASFSIVRHEGRQ